MPQTSKFASVLAGARDTVPMLVGAAPFGMIFGALVSTTELAPWQGQMMSLGVFARPHCPAAIAAEENIYVHLPRYG